MSIKDVIYAEYDATKVTTGAAKAATALDKITVSVKDQIKATNENVAVLNRLVQKQGLVSDQFDRLKTSLRAVNASANSTAASIGRVTSVTREHTSVVRSNINALKIMGANHANVNSQLDYLKTSIRTTIMSINALNAATLKVTKNTLAASSAMSAFASKGATGFKETQKAVNDLHISFGSMVRLVGVQLTHRAIASMTRGIREGIKAAVDLQKNISEIRTISQNNQLSIDKWGEGLRKISDMYGSNIFDVAEAAYQALSNQIAEGADTFRFLESSQRFAIAAVTDLSTAVNLGTAALNAYHLSASSSDQVFGQMFKTIELGRIRGKELENSLGDVTIMAGQLGISLAEVGGALATITIQGTNSSKAMTQVRGILTKLLQPTEEMKNLFDKLGVSSGVQAIKLLKWEGILEALNEHADGHSEILAKLINRQRGLTGAMAMTGQGAKLLRQNIQEIEDAGESYVEAQRIGLESVGKAFEIEGNKVKNFFLQDVGNSALNAMVRFSLVMGGFDTLVKTAGGSIKDIFIAGLISSLVWLGRTKAATDGLSVSLVRLGKVSLANPYIAALTAVTALSLGIRYFYERSEKAREKELQQIDDYWREQLRLAQATIEKIDKLQRTALGAPFHELLKFTTASIAKSNESIRKLLADTNLFVTTMKAGYETAYNALKDIHIAAEKALENQLSTIDEIEKRLSAISKDEVKDIFEIDLRTKDPSGMVKMLSERIRKVMSDAQESRDASIITSGFAEVRARLGEIDNLYKQSSDKRAKLEEDFNNTRTKGIQDVAKIDEQLAGTNKRSDPSTYNRLLIDRQRIIQETNTSLQANKNEIQAILEFEKNSFNMRNAIQKAYGAEYTMLVALHTQIGDTSDIKKNVDALGDMRTRMRELESTFNSIDPSKLGDLKDDEYRKAYALRSKAMFEYIEILKKIPGQEETVAMIQKQFIKEAAVNEEEENIRRQKRLYDLFAKKDELMQEHATKVREALDSETKAANALELALAKANKELEQHLKKSPFLTDRFSSQPQKSGEIPEVTEARNLKNYIKNLEAATEALRQRQRANMAAIDDFAKSQGMSLEAALRNNDKLEVAKATFIDLINAMSRELSQVKLQIGVITKKPENIALGGYKHGRDTIPAMLSPGEFVMSQSASNRFYSVLQSMNSGPKNFAQGGRTFSMGDVNVNMTSSGNENLDAKRIGTLVQRQIKRGALKWT